MNCIWTFDQGTQSTKGMVLSLQGEVLFVKTVPVPIQQRSKVMVEQSLADIIKSIREVQESLHVFCSEQGLTAISCGIATQRSGVAAWSSRDGSVLHELITWRDTRFQSEIDSLEAQRAMIERVSGLKMLPNYAAPKIAALQKMYFDPEIHVGTLDCYLREIFGVPRRFVTDSSMASRTMLYSLSKQAWDHDLCRIFGVDRSRLPEIATTLCDHGSFWGVPLRVMMGDQQAALMAIPARYRGVINIGSIASVLVKAPAAVTEAPMEGLLTNIFYSDEARHHYFMCEAVTPSISETIAFLSERVPEFKDGASIDMICLHGLVDDDSAWCVIRGSSGSPHWRTIAPEQCDRGPHEFRKVVRCAIESIAHGLRYQLDWMAKAGIVTAGDEFVISGGLSQSEYLVRYLAACLPYRLVTTREPHATLLGVAQGILRHGLIDETLTPLLPEQYEGVSPLAIAQQSIESRYQTWYSQFKRLMERADA